MTDSESAVGWDAIDAALERAYPGVEPKHYGTVIKWSMGGPDPLDGISVYQRDDHWHVVSYGVSELPASRSRSAGPRSGTRRATCWFSPKRAGARRSRSGPQPNVSLG